MFLLCASLTWYLLHTTTKQREDAREESEKQDTVIVDGVTVPANQSFFMPHSPLAQSWSSSDENDNLQLFKKLSPLPFTPGGGSSSNVNSQTDNWNGRPKLHVVTYASHPGIDDRFCRCLESVLQNGISLKVLGWGQKWKGLPQKLEAALSYAKSQPKEDVMLFVDAYDVLFMGGANDILNIYLQMGSPKLLFGAECGCWPLTRSCLTRYPRSPTRYRYLNSGTWIARIESAVNLLKELMVRAGKGEAAYIANDQRLASDAYVSGRMGIKIDHYAQLFQSMHATAGPPLPYCNPLEDLVYEPVTTNSKNSTNGDVKISAYSHSSTFKNRKTGSRPLIFHMNGGGKKYLLGFEKGAWYRQIPMVGVINAKTNSQLMQVLVSVVENEGKERRIKFGEMCPNYDHRRVIYKLPS